MSSQNKKVTDPFLFSELDRLFDFINSKKSIYIWGYEQNAKGLGRYLDSCGKTLYKGYVVSDENFNKYYANENAKNLHGLSEISYEDVGEIGFILATSERWFYDILSAILGRGGIRQTIFSF